MYPNLQLHSYDPGLFTQSAFDEQLLAPGVLHSSISAKESLAVIFSLRYVVLQIIQTTEACNNKGHENEKKTAATTTKHSEH